MEMNILTDDAKEKVFKLIEDDLQFVDLPKEILCSNCSAIPLFHYIYPCSHPYCRECYVNVFQRLKKKCRVCKREIGEKMLQSKKLEFAIYRVNVYCPNKEFGCNDEIELHNIVVDDALQKLKRSQRNHEKKTEDRMKEVNDNIGVLAKVMDTSAKWFKITRRNTLNNLNMDELSQEEIQFVNEDVKQWQNKEMLWNISNYDTKRKTNDSVSSGPFCSDDCEHLMRFQLTFSEDGYLYGNIKFDADKNNELLTSGFLYRATISILDRSEGREKRDSTRVFEPRFGTTAMEWMKKEHKFNIADFNYFESTQNKSKYLKNDSIHIKVLVEPLNRLFGNYFSNNGILLCTIDNYARTKLESQQLINFYFYSDYFYSSERGYRMQARLVSGSSYVYFELLFLVGEMDAELPSFYSHKFTIFVVNQKDDSGTNDLLLGTETLDAAVSGEENAKQRMKDDRCYHLFIDYEQYGKDPFLINDQIILKVIVEKL